MELKQAEIFGCGIPRINSAKTIEIIKILIDVYSGFGLDRSSKYIYWLLVFSVTCSILLLYHNYANITEGEIQVSCSEGIAETIGLW